MFNITHHQGNVNQNCKLKKKKLQWEFTLNLWEWLESEREEITGVGKDVEKKEPSHTVGGNVNWCSHCRKQYGDYSKKLKMEIPYDPAIPTLVFTQREQKH